jgi:Ca2+/H+ antiporter, TMEM165/GDT1 family
MSWAQSGPYALAAFLASLVEGVEALTIILAVGGVCGWRGALSGSGIALVGLLAIVLGLGKALTLIPLGLIQAAVGVLLLLFGLRWLRKAILRAASVIALHEEGEIFARQTRTLRRSGGTGWDGLGFATAFQATMLEGIEVVFIVVAIGAGRGELLPASLGAIAALLLVIALAIIIRRPLAAVPENTLKFVVGVLLSAFGTFWAGEGTGLHWPGTDWSIPWLIAGFLAVALAAVRLCRRGVRPL